MNTTSLLLIVTISSAILCVLCVVMGILFVARSKKRLLEAMNLRLFRIRVPQYSKNATEDQQRKSMKETVAVAEQFLSSLISIGKSTPGWISIQEHIAFEIVAEEKKISFYLAIPERAIDLVVKQVQALYPDAAIEPAEEYNFFQKDSAILTTALTLKEPSFFPLKTYADLEADPLNSFLNTLSKMQAREGAAIQYIIRPAGADWRKRSVGIAKGLQQGKSLKELTQSGSGKIFSSVGSMVGEGLREATSSKKAKETKKPDEPKTLTPYEQETIKAIEEKASKAGFDVNVRIVISTMTEERTESLIEGVLAGFKQFDHPAFNSLKSSSPSNRRQDIVNYIYRYFDDKQKMILNTQELASIWHTPNRFIETPYLEWLEARQAPAPTNVPTEGVRLGTNVYRGARHDIYMREADRVRHFYLIGKTGSGKTTLFENMIEQDILAGRGCGILDPHGEFAENVLAMVPKERAEDVIFFDPADLDRPMGLNLLEAKESNEADRVVSEMIGIFRKLFPPEMIGPIFEHQMRNIMLTLLEDPTEPATLAQIPKMFTDQEYQKKKMQYVKNPIVKDFWEKEMAKTSDFHKSETLGYLVSKVGQFVENKMMLNIIGQKSAFDLRDIMDNKKILIVKLSKGKIGDVNADLLGMIIVSKFQMAALSRDVATAKERPFYLYLDEFQNFTTDSIGVILAEARKYGLSLHMAHQFIAQLDDKIREAVFGNVGTIASYRVGTKDAEFLEKEFEPVFSAYDLVNIDKYNAYVKLLVDNAPTRPFNMTVDPPFAIRRKDMINRDLTETIRQLSRLKFGRDRRIVEAELFGKN